MCKAAVCCPSSAVLCTVTKYLVPSLPNVLHRATEAETVGDSLHPNLRAHSSVRP